MPEPDDAPIRIGGWFQGPTGSGNGGWSSYRFASRVAGDVRRGDVTTSIRAPVPLDTDLRIHSSDDGWDLRAPDDTTIMTATVWEPVFADTAPVSVDEAVDARSRFGAFVPEHPVPYCFSCGTQHDSMLVHAAPIGDDRVATDWTLPRWAVGSDGVVDGGALWAALDCCSAWWVAYTRERRVAYTVQYAVEQLAELVPGATYAIVGWAGDHDPEWNGRKRHAASAAFDADGRCVARSVSLWVAPD